MLDELYGASFFTNLIYELDSCWMNSTVPFPLPNSIYELDNINYACLPLIFLKFLFIYTMSTMNIWLCHLDYVMHYWHFKSLWITFFIHILKKSSFFIFFYYIMVYSPSWNDHLVHVKKTLEILQKHQFLIKTSKCVFGHQELKYLGHIITNLGVKVDDTKISTLVTWPRPTNTKALHDCLGIIGYYWKSVNNYGIITWLVTTLLKKGKFNCHDEAEVAFIALKKAMTTTSISAMPNFNDTFIVEMNASSEGIGAMLSQQGKPKTFMSRKEHWAYQRIRGPPKPKKSWPSLWRPYILGSKLCPN